MTEALRAAWWAWRAARRAQRELGRKRPVAEVVLVLPAVPPLPDTAARGMRAALDRRGDTCLVRSIVRQSWETAHGRDRELVIGVAPPADGFTAHAWLDGDKMPRGQEFTEISRVKAR